MRSTLSRRKFLGISAGTLLSMGIWPGRLFAEMRSSENFKFLAVNDLHFFDHNCIPWFARVVAAMKESAPKAEVCLIGGDLSDLGTFDQLLGVRSAFAKLEIEIAPCVGNHDYVADQNCNNYLKVFPNCLNYSFNHRGWQFVVLDSCEGTKSDKVTIAPSTIDWMDSQLRLLDPNRPTILLTHFPMGVGAKKRPLNAEQVLNQFLDFNLQAVFCGHFHGYTESTWREATITTDRCCSRYRPNHDKSKEKGWFVCEAKDGKVTRRFVQVPKP